MLSDLPRFRFGANRTHSTAITLAQWDLIMQSPICVSRDGTQYLLRGNVFSVILFAVATDGVFRSAPRWWQPALDCVSDKPLLAGPAAVSVPDDPISRSVFLVPKLEPS